MTSAVYTHTLIQKTTHGSSFLFLTLNRWLTEEAGNLKKKATVWVQQIGRRERLSTWNLEQRSCTILSWSIIVQSTSRLSIWIKWQNSKTKLFPEQNPCEHLLAGVARHSWTQTMLHAKRVSLTELWPFAMLCAIDSNAPGRANRFYISSSVLDW